MQNSFQIGKIYRLLLIKKDSRFAIFADKFHSLNTIKMPVSELDNFNYDLDIGDHAAVFIYKDNRNYLKATLTPPKTLLNEITTVTINSISSNNNINKESYADWNWHEPIKIPQYKSIFRLKKNHKYVIKVELDPESGQFIGNTIPEEISHPINTNDFQIGQHAVIRILDIQEKQITALIDDKYLGVIDFKSLPIKPEIGEIGFGKIVGFTENNKIPNNTMLIVQLQAPINNLIQKTQNQIIAELNNPKAHGMIPFNDSTSPELVLKHFGVSKNIFKKAIGGLLKDKKIKQTERGIIRM